MRIWKQFILAVIFAIAGIAFTACDKGTDSGTDASSGTDAGEKIIGTWVDGYGIYWDFNADGNLTLSGNNGTDVLLKFGVTDTKLVISSVTGIINSPEGIYNIYMSPNERTLILVRQNNNNYVAFVLTKELYTEQAPVFAWLESKRLIMSTVITAVTAESAIKRQYGLPVEDCQVGVVSRFAEGEIL